MDIRHYSANELIYTLQCPLRKKITTASLILFTFFIITTTTPDLKKIRQEHINPNSLCINILIFTTGRKLVSSAGYFPNPLAFFRSVAKLITFQTTFPTSLKQNPNGHDFKISGRSESSVEIYTRKYKLQKMGVASAPLIVTSTTLFSLFWEGFALKRNTTKEVHWDAP